MENCSKQTDKLYAKISPRPKHHIFIWNSTSLLIWSGKHYPYLQIKFSLQWYLTSRMGIYYNQDPPYKPNQDPIIILLIYQKQMNVVQMGMNHYTITMETSATLMDSYNPNKTQWQGPIWYQQIHIPRRRTNGRTYMSIWTTTTQI